MRNICMSSKITPIDYIITDHKAHAESIAMTTLALQGVLAQHLNVQQEKVVLDAVGSFTADMVALKIKELSTHLVELKLIDKVTINKSITSFTKYYSKYTKPAKEAMKSMLAKLAKISTAMQEVLQDTQQASSNADIDDRLKKLDNMKVH